MILVKLFDSSHFVALIPPRYHLFVTGSRSVLVHRGEAYLWRAASFTGCIRQAFEHQLNQSRRVLARGVLALSLRTPFARTHIPLSHTLNESCTCTSFFTLLLKHCQCVTVWPCYLSFPGVFLCVNCLCLLNALHLCLTVQSA